MNFGQLKYALSFQKSKPKWAYGFLITAAELKLRVREKIFLTKVIGIYNSYKSYFKYIELGRLFLLSGKAKEILASAATKFWHFRSYRKSWVKFSIQIYLRNMSRHRVSKLRMNFEKFHLFMGKISIYQNLKIPFFYDMKWIFFQSNLCLSPKLTELNQTKHSL